MVSLVSFFVDRCCRSRRSAPKACDLEFKVTSTMRRSLSTIELNHQKPIEDLVQRFIRWKVLDGQQRENNLTNLLAWLSLDRGIKYFSSYDRFKQMADQLSIPSSEKEFWETYAAIEQEEGGEEYQLLLQQAKAERKKAQQEALSSVGSI